jgi:hypothetical protein
LKPIFKKMALFSALIALVGVGLFFALSYKFESKSPLKALPTAEGVYDGLQLTMALEKTKYTRGEPINITLILTNISKRTTSVEVDLESYFDFQVYNGTNSTIYSSRYPPDVVAHLPLAENATLNAGQSMSEDLSWHQEGVSVLPAIYYIVGLIGPIYYKTSITIETTPIQITIS